MIDEALLGMQDAPEVEAEDALDDMVAIAPFGLQAHQEARRYRQRAVPGGPGGRFVGVDRVGLADGLGEEAQAALLHLGGGHPQGTADQTLVCHVTVSCQ
ncbi:hypothetical protein D3C81_1811500 [compost metagenome]